MRRADGRPSSHLVNSAAENFGLSCVDFRFEPPQSLHNGLEWQGVAVEHLCRQHSLVVLTQGLEQRLIRNQSQAASDALVVMTETAAIEGFLDAQDVAQQLRIAQGLMPDLVISQPRQVVPVAGQALSTGSQARAMALDVNQRSLLPEGAC